MSIWGWPTGLVHNFEIHLTRTTLKLKSRPSSIGNWYWLSCKPSKSISCAKSPLGVLRARNTVSFFSYNLFNLRNKKLLPMSYARGPVFNNSSTKHYVLLSRNSFAQHHCYYKVSVQWASRNLSPTDSTHKNASTPSYVSHRLSPTSPRKTRSRKKSRSWEISKSRLCWKRTSEVPSHHYVGRTGYHIYDWSARQCRTHLGYTRKVKHQTGIL